MLKDTWPQYLLICVVVVILQHIGPVCLAYTLWNVREAWPRWPINSAFQAWCALEAAFLLFFLWYRVYLQHAASHPPLRSREERKALFGRVRTEVNDPDKFISGWFRGAKIEDIGRDALKEFLNWAFWEGRADMSPGGVDEEELEEYAGKVEKMMCTAFKPGHGTAKSLRLTLDPIDIECRAILWYMLIMLVDTITHFSMKRIGFQYFKTTATSIPVFPPRPAAIAERTRSPARNLSYWIRPHTSKTRLPVLYFHGIGVGLIPHVSFLRELDEALNEDQQYDGQVGVLAIEILQVSSRLTHGILSREEFLRQLTEILDCNGYDRFVLVSHSYGSVLNSHVLTDETLAKRVAANLLIDPVTPLLHMPDVAYNFTVRSPKHANEWQLWYFASKDPGVAYTLGRHFFWSENVLWRDKIMELVQNGMKMTASLASRDLIVDTQAVGTYLTEHEIPDPVVKEDSNDRSYMELHTDSKVYGTSDQWKQRPWRGRGLEVLWWEGLDHAQVFDEQSTRARLVEVIVRYSKTT